MAQVTLLYYASVREQLGLDVESREVPDGVQTVQALIDWLIAQDERYAGAFAVRDKLRCALDQVMAPLDAPLAGASEIAFFPPVTGG